MIKSSHKYLALSYISTSPTLKILFQKFYILLFGVAFYSVNTFSQSYPKPSMISPSSGVTVIQTGHNPCFTWTPINDARFKSYVITVSLSTNFPDQRWAYDVMSMPTNYICWNGGSGWVPKGTNPKPLTDAMKSGTTYYWRALATFNDGTVTGTEITGIPFSLVKPSPSLSSPANGETVYSSNQNPCFSWTMAANSGFSFYTVTLSTTTNFPTTRWAAPFIYSSSTTNICWNNGAGWEPKGSILPEVPNASTLKNGITYYWRVLATFSDGSLTGTEFVGRSFTYRASVTSSSISSRSSSTSSSTKSSSASSAPLTTRFTYDARGRIKTVTRDSGTASSIVTQYTYDRANNRESATTTGSNN